MRRPKPVEPIVLELRALCTSAKAVNGATIAKYPLLADNSAIRSYMGNSPTDKQFVAALRWALSIALESVNTEDNLRDAVCRDLGLSGPAAQTHASRREAARRMFREGSGLQDEAYEKDRWDFRGQPDDAPRFAPVRLTESLILIESALARLAASPLNQGRPLQSDINNLFPPPSDGEQRLHEELTAIDASGSRTWWDRNEGRWFGSYYSFWRKTGTTPCDRIRFTRSEETFHAERYAVNPDENGDAARATIIRACEFRSDDIHNWYVELGVTNWNFARNWVRNDGDKLLSRQNDASVFGDERTAPFPGIACVHVIARTKDGFVLCALRNEDASYYPLTWSVSFEENVAIDRREGWTTDGDVTVFDTLVAGFAEELNIPASAIGHHSCLSVGRHYVKDDQGWDLSSTVIVGAQLNINLNEVWKLLEEGEEEASDRNEHVAWAGISFHDRAQALRLLSFPRAAKSGRDLLPAFAATEQGCDMRFFPGGPETEVEDRGLHMSSPVRLHLGTRWFERIDAIR
jgi:hypothetical protein